MGARRRGIRWVVVALGLLLAASAGGLGAEWIGYWGGWLGLPPGVPHYSGAEAYPPGRWIDGPIRVALVDTAVHAWRPEERNVVLAAIEAWNESMDQIPDEAGLPWGLAMLELLCTDGDDEGSRPPADIVIRWEDSATFFRDWGDPDGDGVPFSAAHAAAVYLPHKVVPFLGDPCSDLAAAGSEMGPGTIVLNRANPAGWFVAPSLEDDEQFEAIDVRFCRVPGTSLRALKGSPAAGRHDLYTVVLHELGHALGLIHSGGCDGNLFSGGAGDDDGRLMWEGYLRDRRSLESHFPVGERRQITAEDLEMLRFYQTAAAIAWMEDHDPERLCSALLAYADLLLEMGHHDTARDVFNQLVDTCADPAFFIPPVPGRHFPGVGDPQILVGNHTGEILVVSYVGPVISQVVLSVGEERILVLPAGTYDIMAVIGDNIVPFYGVMEFLVDWRYVNEFAIIERPVP